MTRPPAPSRRTRPPAAPPSGRGRLWRCVGAVCLAAVVLQVAVGTTLAGAPAVAPLSDLPGWLPPSGLLALLLGACVVAEWHAVRLLHGEEVEELTLAEAAAVVCVLLLPPLQALLLPVVATAAASLLRGRGALKALFNSANAAVGSAVLLGGVHATAHGGGASGLGPATVAGLVLGMTAYTAANLITVARLMSVLSGDDPAQAVRDGLRLSAVMALGTIGLGATAVVVAHAAPALLPFSVLPAAALTFAYRAAVQESEERRRSAVLLALSQVLAGRMEDDAGEDVVEAFLRLTRQAFGADAATALLQFDDGSVARAGDDRVLGTDRAEAGEGDRALLERLADGAAVLPASPEDGWTSGLLAPLEADGRRLGALVVTTRDRTRRLGRSDLSLLTPLAAALAVALRGTDHLRRLLEETSKLQAVVDRSSDGIVVLDGDGVVQLWSPAAQTLTGSSVFDALGLPLGEVLRAATPDGTAVDAFTAGRDLLHRGTPEAVVELVVQRTDGEERVVRCAHAGVFDERGRLERDVVLLHDVTRERQVERLKADFIATVSHELRTPVTPIKGYADLLRRRGDAMTPERRAECLDVIGDRASHLARLVEDLLLASRISTTAGASTASVSMGRHDLAALVRRACADFGDDGERVSVHLPPGEVPAACDAVRAVQVLGNLVGNALKYSAPGTPVDVVLAVDGTPEDGEVRVEVTDRGRGIPADQLERVFDKFHRVEDPMRMTTGGTGLGLYIARELTTAMGGRLWCTSVLGTGSTFVLALRRAARVDPAPDPAARPALRGLPPGHVLPLPRGGAARKTGSAALG